MADRMVPIFQVSAVTGAHLDLLKKVTMSSRNPRQSLSDLNRLALERHTSSVAVG